MNMKRLLVPLLLVVFITPSLALGATKYWYNAGADSQWTTLTGNWWTDLAHSSQSGSLPGSSDAVITLGTVAPIINLDTWTEPLTIVATSTGIIATSSASAALNATTTGAVTFYGSARNQAAITGNVTFNNTSSNRLGYTITGDATFNNSTQNNGAVTGSSTFNGSSFNVFSSFAFQSGTVGGDATFNDTSNNGGIVSGNATINSTVLGRGTISGNATFTNATSSTLVLTGTSIWGTVLGTAKDVLGNTITTYIFTNSSKNFGTVNGSATFYNSSSNRQTGLITGSAPGIITGNATFYSTSYNKGEVQGNATFYDSTINRATVTGNATFYEDLSENISIVSGTQTRMYTASTTITRDFVSNGPWVVTANGALVDATGATYNATTTFTVLNGGSFVGVPDTFVPIISSAATSTTASTASITWNTDEAASSSASYGLTTSYGSVASSTGTTTHAVSISGLSASTVYHYRILAVDASGNISTSTDATFTTAASAAAPETHYENGSGGGGGGGGSSPSAGIIYANNSANNSASNPLCPAGYICTPTVGSGISSLQLGVGGTNKASNNNVNNGGAQYFLKNSNIGKKEVDVKMLQQFLNTHGFVVSYKGNGSPGNETMYFGPATREALIKFQKKNNIKPAVGYFGQITRNVINNMLAGH